MLQKIQLHFHYTTATLLSILAAAITVATTLGLNVSTDLRDNILKLAGLLLAGVVVGGGVKSAGMLNAGVHPIQKASATSALLQAGELLKRAEQVFQAPERDTELAHAIREAPRGGGVLPEIPSERARSDLRIRRGGGHDEHPVLRAHGSFAGLRLGKQEAKHDPRTPMLAEFMSAAAALGRKLPKVTHRLDPVAVALGGDFGMMGNDSYGDCTCAGLGHAIQMWTGAHGQPQTLTAAQILDLYWKTGKADDGRVMFEVLKYAQHNGLAGHEFGAYVGVGLRRYYNRDVKAAIDLFGGCYLGVALPETAQSQNVWDVAGDPSKHGPAEWGSWGGHAIWLADYDHVGPTCITWGHPLKMTWAFLDAYADEGYAVIGPDWLRGGKTIEGIDLAGLTAYLAKIRSGIQPPA